MRTAVTYAAVLIGVYLVLAHATGGGTLLTTGGSAAGTIVKDLQGR